MLHKLFLAAGIAPLVGLGLLASADYAIIDVTEKGPQGHRFVLPVPLVLAQAALRFAPEAARRVELPAQASRHLPVAAALLRALEPLPDFELARVEEPGEQVVVRKAGGRIRIDVHGRGGEEVHVAIPLSAARRVLDSFDGRRLETSGVLAALADSGGPLVHVKDRDVEVSVRLW